LHMATLRKDQKKKIFLPISPDCWDYSCASRHHTQELYFNKWLLQTDVYLDFWPLWIIAILFHYFHLLPFLYHSLSLSFVGLVENSLEFYSFNYFRSWGRVLVAQPVSPFSSFPP
jgi:hypothetical protein